jgi:3-hydroxyisobutyrate dehydrogenase-like beta-hydroxyacid dehydrogenase
MPPAPSPFASRATVQRTREVKLSSVGNRALPAKPRAEEVAAALRGKTLVQFASGSPSEARSAATWAREHGVSYLDGAIMATPELVGKIESTILYAGDLAVFDEREALLRVLAGTTAYVGADHGHAAALDSSDSYLGYVKGLLPVTDAFTIDLIERAIAQHHEDTQATLDIHHGALHHALTICQDRGLDRTIPDAFDNVMKRGRERGLGALDFSALVTLHPGVTCMNSASAEHRTGSRSRG